MVPRSAAPTQRHRDRLLCEDDYLRTSIPTCIPSERSYYVHFSEGWTQIPVNRVSSNVIQLIQMMLNLGDSGFVRVFEVARVYFMCVVVIACVVRGCMSLQGIQRAYARIRLMYLS